MLRIAVLISGGGTNLQSLLDHSQTESCRWKVSMVLADRPAQGLKRAEKLGIPSYMLDRKVLKNNLDKALLDLLEGQCDLIVLAGYLSILSSEFVQTWKDKIINIHPALLPAHGGKGMYGMRVHRSVIEAGDKESGCTVHWVDEEIDHGATILQRKVPVSMGDTAEDLQKKVLEQEHLALPMALDLLADQHG